MEPLLTFSEITKLERRTQEDWGITGDALMESAGQALFHAIANDYPTMRSLVIFSGSGNNGADGLVLGRYAHNAGWAVRVVLLKEKGTELFQRNLTICKRMGITLEPLQSASAILEYCKAQGAGVLAIDALAGIGLKGEPRGVLRDGIQTLQRYCSIILSLDIPSGVGSPTWSGETETPSGTATGEEQDSWPTIRATRTYVLGCLKEETFHPQNRSAHGRITVLPIGFPRQEIQNLAQAHQISRDDGPAMTTGLRRDDFKNRRGRVGVAAGSVRYPGAGVLACRGSLAGGAGLVYSLTSSPHGRDPRLSEQIIPVPLDAHVSEAAIRTVLGELGLDALVIGPGRPPNTNLQAVGNQELMVAACELGIPLVIDAGGIQSLIEDIPLLDEICCRIPRRAPIILTPHLGEFRRLVQALETWTLREDIHFPGGSDSQKTPENLGQLHRQLLGTPRLLPDKARLIAQGLNLHLVVKSHITWICGPQPGKDFVFDGVTPELGFGGSGDILAGIIGAFLSRGALREPGHAAASGVIAHGTAGRWLVDQGRGYIDAEDLLEAVKITAHGLSAHEG
ncbi:NAD(P)H-hydrate epimerase [Spirochaeta lutea]|uniref:Bifunctional NAD(P)H-hydrate repair enzyme n=1 Tax=Spirochaeta lutea TaxID=1480694 RepID=A0A098R064_9SPIO|nr:NAD(P)H-hydrate epimerase [Spirochaeta lutea]KGE73555.1 hypothetical protein DC28_02515 [Spirochaeta lutea]